MIKCKVLSEPTKAYIKENFSYNPETGEILRLDYMNCHGQHDKDGYLKYKIKGTYLFAHRIAWFLYYGEYPKSELDHINRNRTDNRISNLRVVDRITNVRNSYVTPNPITGVRGVYVDTCTKGLKKKYTTRLNGKTYRFYTIEDATTFRKDNNLPI